ncbi:hypothetical protein SAMN04515618_107172 [Collimonas sp. OK307]|uniref:hypothetical protein n=1 Tax=Collimonas sp. OK307 TaxID=1801620 RepID=UPI0008EB151D|nr:hypothetical protein [Collimonas sp. OK307]SFI00302.1 hypothetical protein SAMN04515618_107172 [Collimonas sp. OK307]
MTNRINNIGALLMTQRAGDETPAVLPQHSLLRAGVSGRSAAYPADDGKGCETDDLYKDVAILGYN